MASTGGYWGGRCFASQPEAADAYFGAQPLVISNGSAYRFEKQGITWVLQTYKLEANGAMTYAGQACPLGPAVPCLRSR